MFAEMIKLFGVNSKFRVFKKLTFALSLMILLSEISLNNCKYFNELCAFIPDKIIDLFMKNNKESIANKLFQSLRLRESINSENLMMGDMGQIPNHQVKVDNWPLFFLQRLHHFYKKKSHCDLTLLFSTLDTVKSIKVHKLVLHACTDYFESLDVMKDSEHGEFLQLSNEMHPDVVIPIISFMYTGKLEFPVTLQPRLYEAATKLRMTILTKLLDVQPSKTTEKPVNEMSSILQATPVENSQDGQGLSSLPADISSQSNYSSKKVEDPIITLTPVSKSISQQKKNLKPEVTFIQHSVVPSDKTKCITKKNVGLQQFTTVSSKPKVVDANLPPTLPGRKLPVWKRKVPFTGSQSSDNTQQTVQNVRSTPRTAELPKPTRFEWDEDLNDPTVLRPVEDAPKVLSHDGPTKIIHPIILDEEWSKPKPIFDSSKRSSDGSSSESPPYKKSKSDLQDMKEYGKQQQLRNEIICSEENLDDTVDTDDLYGTCDDEPDELSNFNQSSVNCSTPKPILKTMPKPEPPMSSKRVRFSLEGKENNQQQNEAGADDFTVSKQPESTVIKQKIVVPMDVSENQSEKHHVKIVSEVLKKYPYLAKRENIKLRVVSKNPAAVPPTVQKAVEGDTGGGSKSASSLVSYIFLKNNGSGDVSLKSESNEKVKGFDVENKTGPWICSVCNETNPLEFNSYYTYRRHLVEVHELKIDARICEYCGLKNSKRNHLLYHLYTKHGINPPAHVSFPKCSECDYIALSDALLYKHKATHDPKGLMCYTCNVVFKTYSAMQLHLNSDWHRNKQSEVSVVLTDYPCPFCDARFEGGNDLKDHMEACHHSQRISTNEEHKQMYRCPYCESIYGRADFLGKHIVSVHWGKDSKTECKEEEETCQPQSGQQLQYSAQVESSADTEGTENQPSSELESLNSVASGIAASLSLVDNEQTVVYYEQKPGEQSIGREATVIADECKEYIITDTSEDINSKQSEATGVVESVDIENEDSNSRASNTDEVHPTSCSDHDYSEPQMDESFRQDIPVHTVANEITEGSVIQQIVPDQGLVFANEGNVVFQSPCINLPQRVLLTSGKMVLPRVSGEQNMILSQVIPQTQIILSGSILQQPGAIIDEGNSTIVFTNSDATQLKNIQAVHYEIQTPESEIQVKSNEEDPKEEGQQIIQEKEETVELQETENLDKEKDDETSSNLNSGTEDPKASRVETSKIVDDWDEMNENSQNVESRGDGPSRPEFF